MKKPIRTIGLISIITMIFIVSIVLVIYVSVKKTNKNVEFVSIDTFYEEEKPELSEKDIISD